MREAIVPAALADAARDTGFSPAIRAGDFVYLTGATGGDAKGHMPPDVSTQARNAFGKALSILEQAGASADNVVEITSYHIGIDQHFAPIQRVMEAVFAAPLPAWTAVEVAALRRPGALVEFRIVAHCPSGSDRRFTLGDLMQAAQPHQWGLRGDPVLWGMMQALFKTTRLPESETALVGMITTAFENITGSPLATPEDALRVKALSRPNGGMSNGMISPSFWRETALPGLVAAYKKRAAP